MSKLFYSVVFGLVKTFSPSMKTEWEVPFEEGPCVFVVNHEGAAGPVNMVTKFPLRKKCHPWINAPVLDKKAMPEYVRLDHWWNENGKLAPLWSRVVPPLAAAVIPPIMKEAGGIAVYRDNRIMTTLRESIKLLKQGEYLMIFPEAVTGHGSYGDSLHTGWLSVAAMYGKATDRCLPIYPVHMDLAKHTFRVSAPILYDKDRPLGDQTEEICNALIQKIKPSR